MQITFSPIRSDTQLLVIRDGEKLIINGEILDFALLPNGATLPAEAISNEWISGDVSRINGQLQICLRLPHSAEPSPDAAFPKPLANPHDGQLLLPQDEKQEEAQV